MDNSIYVKFEYNTLIDSKKLILSSQINCLNILKKMESYNLLRKKEFIYKLKIKNNLKEIKERLNEINKEEIPYKAHEMFNDKRKEEKELERSEHKIVQKEVNLFHKEVEKENSLEQDLLDIQRRLAALS